MAPSSNEKMVKVTLLEGKTLRGARTPPARRGEPAEYAPSVRGDGKTRVEVPLRVVLRNPQVFVEGDDLRAEHEQDAFDERTAAAEAESEAAEKPAAKSSVAKGGK